MPTRLYNIADNVRAALASIMDGPAPLFSEVSIYDDLDSFIDLAVGKLGKRMAGVIVPPSADRLPPASGDEEYSEAAELTVAFSFTYKRTVGKDESGALVTMGDIGQAIRTALMADPGRGGLANLVEWGGRLVNGTNVEGDARLVTAAPNQAIYTAEMPVAVGWVALVAV